MLLQFISLHEVVHLCSNSGKFYTIFYLGRCVCGGVELTTYRRLVQRLRTPLPQYVIMAWYFVKQRDTFTLHLCLGKNICSSSTIMY